MTAKGKALKYVLTIGKDMVGREVIVRTYSAGVFFGLLVERDGKEVVLKDTIRIHYWDGAATLSQMAMEGVKRPENCRFATPLNEILLTEAVEIIPVTPEASESVKGVTAWKV